MTLNVCLVRSDLSHIRRSGPGGEASWTATPIPDAAERDDIKPMLDRVRAAAAWCATGTGRRRLDRVVIDVDESVCLMVRTPSTARPVLAASVRAGSQDWGDLAPITGLEPLIDPPSKTTRKQKGAQGPDTVEQESDGVSVAVISQTDALTRLWLDALDARGIRIGEVCSLWHAAAQAWGGPNPNEVTLVLLCEPERIVWSMARGMDLLCGGSASVPTAAATEDALPASVSPPDPLSVAVRRCSLDWLSWSGQLGVTPDRVVAVGPRAGTIVDLLPAGWKRTPASSGGSTTLLDTHVDADPVGLTCTRLAHRPTEPGRPRARRSLVRLSSRPTRVTRWRYGWAAAALVILGLGFGGLGYRLAKAGNELRAASQQVREHLLARARTVVPNIAPNSNVVWDLEAVVGKMRQAPAFAAPSPPPKIFDELLRVCESLAKFPGAKIKSVSLAGDGGRLACTVADRESNELLMAALKDGGLMEWAAPRDASTDFTTLNLNGGWRK